MRLTEAEEGKEYIISDINTESEESITSSYVKNEHPDVIINIVDATNLSRML